MDGEGLRKREGFVKENEEVFRGVDMFVILIVVIVSEVQT